MFINTLPLRVQVTGKAATEAVRDMQNELAELTVHEHAPLALAQQASGMSALSPLFTALFNYRHTQTSDTSLIEGVELVEARNAPTTR